MMFLSSHPSYEKKNEDNNQLVFFGEDDDFS